MQSPRDGRYQPNEHAIAAARALVVYHSGTVLVRTELDEERRPLRSCIRRKGLEEPISLAERGGQLRPAADVELSPAQRDYLQDLTDVELARDDFNGVNGVAARGRRGGLGVGSRPGS